LFIINPAKQGLVDKSTETQGNNRLKFWETYDKINKIMSKRSEKESKSKEA